MVKCFSNRRHIGLGQFQRCRDIGIESGTRSLLSAFVCSSINTEEDELDRRSEELGDLWKSTISI